MKLWKLADQITWGNTTHCTAFYEGLAPHIKVELAGKELLATSGPGEPMQLGHASMTPTEKERHIKVGLCCASSVLHCAF